VFGPALKVSIRLRLVGVRHSSTTPIGTLRSTCDP
jgi:hypothetical protein